MKAGKIRGIHMVITLASLIPVIALAVAFLGADFFPHALAALLAGLTLAATDFVYEAIAAKQGLWHCNGGIQVARVPLEMTGTFVAGGFSMALSSSSIPWLLGLGAYAGSAFLIGYVLVLALFGAISDYSSISMGVWEPGKDWNFWKCMFWAWLPLLLGTIFVDRVALVVILVVF
jgi:hypothetical protein